MAAYLWQICFGCFVLNIYVYSVIAQTFYIERQFPSNCKTGQNDVTHEYFDVSQLRCLPCAQASSLQTVSADGLRCVCQPTARLVRDYGGSEITCAACPSGQFASLDGWECIICSTSSATPANVCPGCIIGAIAVDRLLNGSWSNGFERNLTGTPTNLASPSRTCETCVSETTSNIQGTRCERCNQVLSVLPTQLDCVCPPTQLSGGLCFQSESDLPTSVIYAVPFGTSYDSEYLFNNLKAAYAMCSINYKNLTACQSLGNMCVMIMYNQDNAARATERDACTLYFTLASQYPRTTLGPTDWPENMPWLFYSTETTLTVLTDTRIATQFTFPTSKLDFYAATYGYNGTYLGLQPLTNGLLQFCKNTQAYLDAAYTFGTTYSQSCDVKITDLYAVDPLYYDIYVNSSVNGAFQLYAVPILVLNYRENGETVNLGADRANWKLNRRMFMVDTVSGYRYDITGLTSNKIRADNIWYASAITFHIELQEGQTQGLIYPPYVSVQYTAATYDTTATVPVTFNVEYSMSVAKYNSDIAIAVGVLTALMFVYTFFQTFAWNKRAGQIAIDFLTMMKFVLIFCGNLANVFFVVTFGSAMWYWIFFKQQSTVFLLLPTRGQEQQFLGFLGAAFALKGIQLLGLIIEQVTVDIFFIDWERPSGKIISSNDVAQKGQEAPVSIWRTYFVANEWNEIQTTRKINGIFQVFAVIFFLHVIGFENLTTADPWSSFSVSDGNYHSDSSRILRFAVSVMVYLLVAVAQWLFFVLFYERFMEDKVRQYVDLCSMSNVSVFIMQNSLFGYYIHGRSVHGKADTGLREMSENMKREEADLCGQRGLLPNTEQQTFEVALPKKLRLQYDKVMLPITQVGQGPQAAAANKANSQSPNSHLDAQTEKCVQAYNVLNRFLQAFIDHSLKDIDYFVKDKNLLESILRMEFQDTKEKGHFFNDNGHSFDQVLFFGNETTLTLFSVLFFTIIDLIFTNFVLAAVLTYLLMEVVIMIRDSLGRSNLARKTLVDKRFLI